ncbi:MAG TPA: phage holin family protein [Patescibacteria group bacterium]|nr:phage holin family protein [Patescibacteria group bacterium]
MKKQFIKFLIRWFANGAGLYIAAHIFNLVNYQNRLSVIIIASFILSLLNVLIKPILVIFTLPAIALTLGIFMVIINGFIVFLATTLYDRLQVSSFWTAILVGMVIGLVNYIVTIAAEAVEKNHA